MSDTPLSPDTLPVAFYDTNGTSREFPYPFPIFEAADLDIRLDDTRLFPDASLTITGVGSREGGGVVFAEPPAAGHRLVLRRAMALKRETDFRAGGILRARTLNAEFDRQVAALQQVDAEIRRTMVVPLADRRTTPLDLPSENDRANRILGFDAAGDPAVSNCASLPLLDTLAEAALTSGRGLASVPRVACQAELHALHPWPGAEVWLSGCRTPGDGGAGLYAWTTGEGWQEDGGLVLASATKQGFWVRSPSTAPISAAVYGAMGDGTIDDSDALEALLAGTARTVRLPPGTYRLTRTLVCRATSVLGSGATLVYEGNGPALYVPADSGTRGIEGLSVHSGSNTADCGLLVEAPGLTLHDITLHGFSGVVADGLRLRRAHRLTAVHCTFRANGTGVGTSGEPAELSDDLSFLSCVWQNNAAAMRHRGGHHLVISGGILSGEAFDSQGLILTGGPPQAPTSDILVEGVRIHGVWYTPLVLGGGGVVHNVIVRDPAFDIASSGIAYALIACRSLSGLRLSVAAWPDLAPEVPRFTIDSACRDVVIEDAAFDPTLCVVDADDAVITGGGRMTASVLCSRGRPDDGVYIEGWRAEGTAAQDPTRLGMQSSRNRTGTFVILSGLDWGALLIVTGRSAIGGFSDLLLAGATGQPAVLRQCDHYGTPGPRTYDQSGRDLFLTPSAETPFDVKVTVLSNGGPT